MRQHKAAQNRFHERISPALAEKFVDPELKPAVQRELRAEDFVLAEDQKKGADADAQHGESARFAGVSRERHAGIIFMRARNKRNKKTANRLPPGNPPLPPCSRPPPASTP